MATILTKKKDTTGAPLAGDLTNSSGGAELAVNTADKRLYTKDSGGNVVELGTNPTIIDVDNLRLDANSIISTNTNGNIAITPNGTGEVDISKVDIDSGAIDGTAIGANSASTGSFTTLTASGQTTVTGNSASTPAVSPVGDTNTGIFFPAADTIAFAEGGAEAMRIDSDGDVGIGTNAPSTKLHVFSTGSVGIQSQTSGAGAGFFQAKNSSGSSYLGQDSTGGYLLTDYSAPFLFYTNNAERARITSGGEFIVGKTSTDLNTAGAYIAASGVTVLTRSGAEVLAVNRTTNNGTLVGFYKDGTTVGVIGTHNGDLYIGTGVTGLGFFDSGNRVIPFNTSTGGFSDDTTDLGDPGFRWDDIYATNGTIQTSDANEKQDIESLSEAETRVAVAAKGLLKKYRWKSAVAKKGDDARIHFGIIAQDLKAAFEAEGLDAGRYAMFIHSAWWEKERVIPAVEAQEAVYETQTDEDGNETQVLVSEAVEGQPERTVTDTFETEAEAPEGAVRKERMGIRYNELLAFMVAAL